VKQVASLLSALMLMGYDEEGAMRMANRVAYDSMPPARREALLTLGTAEELPIPDIADQIGLPTNTAVRVLEDMAALRIVDRAAGRGGPGGAHRWSLAPHARELWEAADANEPRNVGTPQKSWS
jgi:DNA-binding IclR family transcriptional regulator